MNERIKSIMQNPALLIPFLGSRRLLNFLSDETYLKLLYKIKTGKRLHLKQPETFNEWMQWCKIYDRNPQYTQMVDKYSAKEYVKSILGEKHIIPTIGVWNHFDEIEPNELPNRFVLKTTHDSGGIVICRDKESFDWKRAKKILNKHLRIKTFYAGREWPYKNVKPRIIAEKYMEQEDGSGLVDYKFFCFNGIPEFLYISKGLDHHATACVSFYDMEGKELPFHRKDYKPYNGAHMPINFEEMKKAAQVLAKDVGAVFVRIDFYSINADYYFSEITFSPCGGIIPFEPDSADRELGRFFVNQY